MDTVLKHRLDELQAKLEARGVRDIKFCYNFSFDSPNKPSANQLGLEICDIFDAIERGEYKRFEGFGDSVRTQDEMDHPKKLY